MADNLQQPLLIVNTQAQVAGQASPASSQSAIGSYAAGQTLNQTLVLSAGQSYAPNIGFSSIVINTTGPVQLLAALGSNPTYINQTVNQQTTIDTAVDSFSLTNNGTTSVTVNMLLVVAANNSTPPTGVVTSLNSMIGNINVVAGSGISVSAASQAITVTNTGVTQLNGLTGVVSLSASNLPGLAAVALTGEYSALIGAPGAYTLPVATSSVLGGIKVGSGLTVAQDGTLSTNAFTESVSSVNAQTGAVVVKATDNGAANSQSLIANSGATTGDIVLNRLAVAGTGLALSTAGGVTTITSSGLQGAVLTVDGQAPVNGNVVVQAVDNTGTGNSLIKSSGATTGNLTFNKIYAGNNITVTPDTNGNLVVAGTVNAYTLPAATTTVLGGVKAGANVAVASDGTISVANPYVLSSASSTFLGGVKIGANISIAGDGTISVAAPYVLPVATTTVLGGVKQGSNVNIASDGTISVANPYALPIASSTVLGGIKVGANLSIAGDGTLSGNAPYVLPAATTSTLGGVIVGSGLAVASGVLSATYTLPVATTSVLGGVKQGNGVAIASDGTISVASTYVLPVATASVLGGVKIGSNVSVAGDGTISVAAPYVLPIASATSLGGIKVGANLNLDDDGTLWANPAYPIVPATATVLGGVKIGANVNVLADGTISVAAPYALPVASSTVLGGIKVGSGLAVAGDGTLSATPYVLPSATTTTLGGVIIGSGLSVTSGTISVANVAVATANAGTGSSLVLNNGAVGVSPASIARISAGTGITVTPDGNQNLVIASTVVGGVSAVSGQTGNVVVKAESASPQTGTFSIIANSGATTGTITTHDLVAGSGVTIAPDGNSNLVISSSSPVISVSGQVGAVVVQAEDNNTATGVSVISNSGATTGTIKLLRIVAGPNITLGADGSGNLEITGATPTEPYTLPVATASVLGGVKIGANVTVAGDGTISVATPYTLPVATTTNMGGVIVPASGGILVDGSGNITLNASDVVTSFNTRTGAVTLTIGDVTAVGGVSTTQLAAAKYYDIPGGAPGTLAASQLILQHVAVRTITWNASFGSSHGYASVAATASTTFTIAVNGTTIGTMVFAASATTATFTLTGSTSITAGQVLTVTGPATPDATLANVTFTLLGVAT
jgi:hypothetical protein